MEYNIGDVIGEFKESDDPDAGYTTELRRLLLVKGRIPANGDWQIICLDDMGFQREIPEEELKAKNGRYIIGGENIVRHEAGLEIYPEKTISTCTSPYTIDLKEIKGVANNGKVNY